MSRDGLIMGLGLLIAVEPFLGFPNTWDAYILVALGVAVIGMGIVVRRAKKTGSVARQKPPQSPYEAA